MGLGVGGNDGDGVTELEDLLVAQDRTIPAVTLVVERQHDEAVDAVLAAGSHDILGGDDLLNAGHLLSRGGVNALDQRVADLGLHQRQTQGALGHLQGVVRAEVPGAGDLLGGGGTDVLGANDGVAGGLENQVFLGDLAPDDPGSVHHGVHERLIAGAAAQVAVLLEPVANLFTGGRGVVIKQYLGGHDEAGGAEAALSAAVGHPGHLQGMQVGQGADAFDGRDLCAVLDLAQLGQAGAGDLAVYDDVTGAAVALAAADLTAGEQQALPQEGRQCFVLIHQNVPGDAVDDECFLDHSAIPP